MSKIGDIIQKLLPRKNRDESDDEFVEEFDDVDKDFVESLQPIEPSSETIKKEDIETHLYDTNIYTPSLDIMEENSPVTKNADEDGKSSQNLFSKLSLSKKISLPKLGKNKQDAVKKSVNEKSSKTRKPLGVKNKAVVFAKLFVLILMAGAFGFVSYKMFFSDSGSTNQPVAMSENDDLSEPEDYVLNQDILAVNPFVQIEKLAPLNGSRVVSNGGMSPVVGARALPAIPNSSSPVQASVPSMYRSSTPALPPIPSIAPSSVTPLPSSDSKPSQNSSPAVTVQGVFTGSDGNNMAILSDGSVVSEGESYQDGRIAYIGGDGIKFDDGKTMNYGDR